MSSEALRALGSVDPQRAYQGITTQKARSDQTSFADSLRKAVSEVDQLQKQRDVMVDRMVSGEVTEVHDVMAAAEEAQLAFELLLEVRTKLLESYQEIMRMQV